MQDASEEATRKRWDAWEELTAGLPVPQDSEFFRAKVKASGGTYSFDQALSDYYDQPAIVAARRSTHFLWEGGNLPREFTVEREVALSRARVRATNAAVLVTRRGRWSTPEDLRNAGQLTDQEKELSFAKVVHSYLERLRPDDMVAFVDFRN